MPNEGEVLTRYGWGGGLQCRLNRFLRKIKYPIWEGRELTAEGEAHGLSAAGAGGGPEREGPRWAPRCRRVACSRQTRPGSSRRKSVVTEASGQFSSTPVDPRETLRG